MEEDLAGVKADADVAGQQEEQVEQVQAEKPEAAPETQAATGDETVERAFAKRLAAERSKLERQIREQYDPFIKLGEKLQERGYDPRLVLAELEKYEKIAPPLQPYESSRTPSGLSEEQLAEQLGLTPEATRALLGMYQQVQTLAQAQLASFEQAEEARLKAQDPAFDRKAVDEVRADFAKRYGVMLSLEDAWKLAAASKRMEEIRREAEQRALAQVAAGKKAATQPPEGGTSKPSIWDLSDEEFDALVERVRAGGRIDTG